MWSVPPAVLVGLLNNNPNVRVELDMDTADPQLFCEDVGFPKDRCELVKVGTVESLERFAAWKSSTNKLEIRVPTHGTMQDALVFLANMVSRVDVCGWAINDLIVTYASPLAHMSYKVLLDFVCGTSLLHVQRILLGLGQPNSQVVFAFKNGKIQVMWDSGNCD
jgi:hypothetical protein